MAIEKVPWRCSALLILSCLIIVTLALGSCYLFYQFPRAAATQYHRLGGLHNRNVLSHGPGGQKSETKVSAGLVPSEAGRENLFHASLLASGGLLAILGVPWLVNAPPCSLPSCSHGVLLVCMSLSKFTLFIRTSVILGWGPP